MSESGFVLCIALPSLSRESRINMKKSINQSVKIGINNFFLFIMYENLNLNTLIF